MTTALRILGLFVMSFWVSPGHGHGHGHASAPPSSILPNGVLKLIIKTYIDELLSMTSIDDHNLRDKLLGLSEHITSHPALYQRHLFVGQKPPVFDPDQPKAGKKGKQTSPSIRKRQQELPTDITAQFPSEEICTTNRQWEQINQTHDFYDNQVEVIQEEELQQYVFTYRCAASKGPCIGISPLYHSECTERFGWMYMYYKKEVTDSPQWGYVAAPHHCACKIQPKILQTALVDEN